MNNKNVINNIFEMNVLKVRKYLKQFLEFSIIPKNERKTIKIILRGLKRTFFLRFLEELRSSKIAFEIY